MLTINSNAPGGPLTLTLTGNAEPPLPKYVVVDLETGGASGSQGTSLLPQSMPLGTIGGTAHGYWGDDQHAALCDLTGLHDLGTLGCGLLSNGPGDQ